MIDKLELRIPSATEYTRAFGSLYVSLWSDSVNNPFRPSRHYAAVGDLRHFGYDVILHAHCKHGEAGNHKLELIDTGVRLFHELLQEVEAVFEGYASILEIMRIDFAVDVIGVPVVFFKTAPALHTND